MIKKNIYLLLVTSVRHIKSFWACKTTHFLGKRSAGKALLLFKPQQTRPSSAALGYCRYVISGPGFHKANRKVCQAIKWREQNTAVVEKVRCGHSALRNSKQGEMLYSQSARGKGTKPGAELVRNVTLCYSDSNREVLRGKRAIVVIVIVW